MLKDITRVKKFMDEDFLLQNETAKYLYHEHAKNMPIFDFHCHLIPSEIAEDKKYNNITEIWLYGISPSACNSSM